MIFAQFYTRAVPNKWNDYSDHMVEACGDRSVIILDGRNRVDVHHDIAASECRKRGYIAYQIHSGSFSESVAKTKIVELF